MSFKLEYPQLEIQTAATQVEDPKPPKEPHELVQEMHRLQNELVPLRGQEAELSDQIKNFQREYDQVKERVREWLIMSHAINDVVLIAMIVPTVLSLFDVIKNREAALGLTAVIYVLSGAIKFALKEATRFYAREETQESKQARMKLQAARRKIRAKIGTLDIELNLVKSLLPPSYGGGLSVEADLILGVEGGLEVVDDGHLSEVED